jgi:DNA-binding PadR family transcriptional regulator
MSADDGSDRGAGRHGGKRGRGGRLLDYGEFRHVVLTLLAEQPRHGYDIIRAVDQRTAGAYSPSPGVVYPTLALLEDVGHARAVAGSGARNRYEITPEGRAFLRDNKLLIDGILSRMNPHPGSARAGASPVIIAAMDRLKAALRSGARPWSADEAQAVAAAIDVAAEGIRRLRKTEAPSSTLI